MKKQISFNGLFKKSELLQFDDSALYIGNSALYIGNADEQTVVSLADISSLVKTSTKLNNRYFWELTFADQESLQTRRIEFRPNNTLWNRNFPQFHALLGQVNPSAIKTPYRWWYF